MYSEMIISRNLNRRFNANISMRFHLFFRVGGVDEPPSFVEGVCFHDILLGTPALGTGGAKISKKNMATGAKFCLDRKKSGRERCADELVPP